MTIRTFLADRRVRWTAGGLVVFLILLLVLLAAFPWGVLKPQVERRLSDRLGRPVTIGAIVRRDVFSLSPTLEIRDLRAPQPDWAGPGNLARIDQATVTFGALPLLIGRLDVRRVTVERGSLNLARRADGVESWTEVGKSKDGQSGRALDDLIVRDLAVSYRDAKVDRRFAVRIASDAAGFRVGGEGAVMGAPIAISVRGPAIGAGAGKPWPFVARLSGPALDLAARGTMDRPLDLPHMTFALTARADDLKRIDAVIEAGLFGTQPVNLQAQVRHDGRDWDVQRLSGTIGSTDLTGKLTVKKANGRVRLDGNVVSQRLDFDDLASDAGRARGLALERAEGLKLAPNTRINIRKMGETDGRITFDVRHIVSARRPSSLAWAKGVLTIEKSLLAADPFRLGLTRGVIAGRVAVDQRGGAAVPRVTLDLTLTGGSLATLAGGGGGDIDAPVRGRVKLTGAGSTIREAVGRSDGRIGIVASDGVLPARIASMLGFDAGRALTTGGDARARLRCAVAILDVRQGLGRFDPLLIDTSRSGMTGRGTLRFPAEALAVTLTGAPKRDSLIRLPGSVTMAGTLRDPQVSLAPGTKSAGNILKAIGRAISGNQGALASDADCAGLSARALR